MISPTHLDSLEEAALAADLAWGRPALWLTLKSQPDGK